MLNSENTREGKLSSYQLRHYNTNSKIFGMSLKRVQIEVFKSNLVCQQESPNFQDCSLHWPQEFTFISHENKCQYKNSKVPP